MAELYHTIYVHKEVTPDSLIAVFMLQTFGDFLYPGIRKAHVDVKSKLPEGKDGKYLETKGVISLGYENGLFPALGALSLSSQIAKKLNMQEETATAELIAIAEEKTDKKYVQFREILEPLIDEYKATINKAFKASRPILESHYHSLRESLDPIATEYMNRMQEGKLHAFVVQNRKKEIRAILIESDHPEMAQFLHNHKEIEADVVSQVFDGGHVNITTRHKSRINLDDLVSILRIEESRAKKLPFDNINWNELTVEDRLEHLEEWKYDPELPGIFNTKAPGKARNGATQISTEDLKQALKNGLDKEKLDRKCPPVGCIGKKCKFYFYNLQRCQDRRKNKNIDRKKLELESQVTVMDSGSLAKLNTLDESDE